MAETGPHTQGVRTGLENWDLITGGFSPGHLYLIASRPAVGKTSLAFQVASHAAIYEGHTTALFTPGMRREEVALRLLCAQADINSLSVASGRLSEHEWVQLAGIIKPTYESSLFIDDSVALHTDDILFRCEALPDSGLKLIVIDGLDLLNVTPGGRAGEEDIGEAARSLKLVARELDVPIIVTCGVSRTAEQRGTRRPYLTDLPGKGRLEEVADGISFLYRSFADPTPYTSGEANTSIVLAEATELIIAKNPNGPLGTIRIGFVSEFRKFIDWEETADLPTGF